MTEHEEHLCVCPYWYECQCECEECNYTRLQGMMEEVDAP